MRLTVKLRDGSTLHTEHIDLEGVASKDLCVAALSGAVAAIWPEPPVKGGAGAVPMSKSDRAELRKTSRLGSDARAETATRDPLPDIEG